MERQHVQRKASSKDLPKVSLLALLFFVMGLPHIYRYFQKSHQKAEVMLMRLRIDIVVLSLLGMLLAGALELVSAFHLS